VSALDPNYRQVKLHLVNAEQRVRSSRPAPAPAPESKAKPTLERRGTPDRRGRTPKRVSFITIVILAAVVALVAAIVIPSLLRARVSANESTAIGNIRTVISAQVAYSSTNAGFFDAKLECLARPSSCIPRYRGPAMLNLDELVSTRAGYVRRLTAGARAPREGSRDQSPSSVVSFAYLAVPEKVGSTGLRGFCGDSSGVICYTADGSSPRVSNGACELSSCITLR
jgi:hypothetical protein